MVLLLGTLAWLGPAPRPAPPTPEAGSFQAVDGDTLRAADGRRIRLPGVDAPETGRRCAQQATRLVAAFLTSGPVRIEPADGPADRYGRLLADARVGPRSLSRELVRAGLAWVRDPTETHLLPEQVAAVRAGRGVHAGLEHLSGGPWRLSARRFHRADCPWLRQDGQRLALAARVGPLLERGLAPCRTCLPWPP